MNTLNMKSTTVLFEEKSKEFKRLVSELDIDDVKLDKQFNATKSRIKKDILLKSVKFNQPVINKKPYTTQKRVDPYLNPMGGTKDVQVVTVDFPFNSDGSEELFTVIPIGVIFSQGEVYQPDGNSVPVEVEMDKLDKPLAISKTNQLMNTTFDIITKNNIQAEDWSKRMETIIDSRLEERRKELIDFSN